MRRKSGSVVFGEASMDVGFSMALIVVRRRRRPRRIDAVLFIGSPRRAFELLLTALPALVQCNHTTRCDATLQTADVKLRS
jgi:hypothetical protein